MKTSHFEGRIALGAAVAAQGRDESTQREPATLDFDFGGAWLMGANCSEKRAELIVALVKAAGHIWLMPDGNEAGKRCAQSPTRTTPPGSDTKK